MYVYSCITTKKLHFTIYVNFVCIRCTYVAKIWFDSHISYQFFMPQKLLQLSSLLQDYISDICSCGDITVTITVRRCTDQTAMYSVQLTGVMATEAALLLITKMQDFTEGLDLGIAVLFLKEQIHHSKSNQNNAIESASLIIIITSNVIIAIISSLLSGVMVGFYLHRKYSNKYRDKKHSSNNETMTKPYSAPSALKHHNISTFAPKQTSTYSFSYSEKIIAHTKH